VCVHEICLQSLREALETGFTNLTTLKMSQNPIGDNGMLQVRYTINTFIHTLFLFLSGSLSGSPSICMNIYPVPFFFLALFLACRSQYPSLVFCLSLVLSACKRTARASTGWEQEDPLKHRARTAGFSVVPGGLPYSWRAIRRGSPNNRARLIAHLE
jgi:hypothetical protein